VPITALKIEQTDNDELSNLEDNDLNTEADTIQYCDQTEEIILIGEKTDIKKLLTNQNNQLTNFFLQNDKTSVDANYKSAAKTYVNVVIDSALSQIEFENSSAIEKKPANDSPENIIEYYKNLEKHLSIVRHEIDKLKSDAYMDLEYINQALKENSIESDVICKDHLSDSCENMFEPSTNYDEIYEMDDCNQSHTDYADYAPSTDFYSKHESDNAASLVLINDLTTVRHNISVYFELTSYGNYILFLRRSKENLWTKTIKSFNLNLLVAKQKVRCR
jgi:hypothetical protein